MLRIALFVLLLLCPVSSSAILFSGAACSVGLDANGFSVFAQSSDTQIYYVSSSGSDAGANTCLVQVSPCQTLAYTKGKLRADKPDWLLLKKGDTWINEQLGQIITSGRSACEPMLISSYGTGARPLIKTSTAQSGISTSGAGGGGSGGNYLAITGIEFYAYTRDPGLGTPDTSSADGISFLNRFDWMLIEDCKFSFYSNNIDISSALASTSFNLSLRRNVIVSSYNISPVHSQGIYIDTVSAPSIVENLFDHNGWNVSVSGAEATIFNHNVYLKHSANAVFTGNISTNASSHGAQIREGGTVSNNLLVQDPIGILIGDGDQPSLFISSANVTSNVILNGNDIGASARGWGIDLFNTITSGVQATSNIIAHKSNSGSAGHGVDLDTGTSANVVTGNIVCEWDSPITDAGSSNVTTPNSLKASNCNATGWIGSEPGGSDHNRSIGDYNAQISGCGALPGGCTATLAAFLTSAYAQSKDNWNTALMAGAVNTYIRAGFGL